MSASHLAVRSLYVRLLGLTHFVAFASLALQVEGLVGGRGILPLGELLEWLRRNMGPERFYSVPTVFWLDASDRALVGVAWAGAALGLLLEASLLSIFFMPWRLRIHGDARDPPPSRLSLLLLRLLIFRLMFSSGAVKLASDDPTWRGFTAMQYHYETQPIPSFTAFYAQQLPAIFQSFSTLAVLGLELVVPWTIFGPRRVRLLGFWLLVGLQLLIAATGNFAFFNLLTIALCVPLLDDAALPWRRGAPATAAAAPRLFERVGAWPAAIVTLPLSLLLTLHATGVRFPWPAPVAALYQALLPLDAVNPYGLFAVMTTSRPEIVVEGSRDGERYLEYEFRYKPGDPARRPVFVAPHQPRLDWQMWFAALGSCEGNPWFQRFLIRLREGSPPVLALLAHNPFPDEPPRYLRTTLYDYHFTSVAERSRTGAWWRRERLGPYCPLLTPGGFGPGY